MLKDFTILAIDTSCDETSVAITRNDRVLSNVIASQVEFHSGYGGVVPHIAKRMHQKFLPPSVQEAIRRARLSSTINDLRSSLDAVAVTVGPGLAPALEVGLDYAKTKSLELNLPLIAVNHMEAHLLSSFAKNSHGMGNAKLLRPSKAPGQGGPILALLISGGHTQLVLMHNFGKYELIGETLDDAAGEAFDKVAKMLDLGYPGGPIISELAKVGSPIIKLPIPMRDRHDLNFSFSGLKTACMNVRKSLPPKLTRSQLADFAASFESAVIAHLLDRLNRAITLHQPKQIVLGGGVISNIHIRQSIRSAAKKHGIPVFIPYSKKLFTDNAAMVGVAAYYQVLTNRQSTIYNPRSTIQLDRQPNLNFA